MKLESIHIQGFGCLAERAFDCLPGLNIFYGLNETGKSTLQQAIWALLYGFFSGNRKLPAEASLLERYRPWSNARYAGHLVYRLESGSAFRIVRVFDSEDLSTSVSDADTGRDITNQFERGRLGRVLFAREHFGLSQEVFINTCFVRQADLHHLADAAQEISETIVNLSGTGSQDRSVKRALELLEKAFKDQVGSQQARIKPLPKAQARLAALVDEARDIRARRHELESAYQRRSELIHTRDQLVETMARLDLQASITQRERLVHQIKSVSELMEKMDKNKIRLAALSDVAEFPLELRETVNRLSPEWTSYSRSLAEAKAEIEAFRPEAVDLQQRRSELIQIIGLLESTRGTPIEQENKIRGLESHWREVTSAVVPLEKSLSVAQAAVDELESVRESAARRLVLREPALQSLHDMGMSWESAERDLVSAEMNVDNAQKNLLSTIDSLDTYEALDAKFNGMTPAIVSDLKEREANLKETQEKLRLDSESQPRRLLWLATSVFSVAGVVALALGLTRSISGVVLAGGGMVAAAAIAFAMAVQRRRRLSNSRNAAAEAAKALEERLDQYGFESVTQFERSYFAYLAAQPSHIELARSRTAVEERHKVVEYIRNQAREVLGLSPETTISLDALRAAESDGRKITEQMNELHRREERRDQLARDLRGAMDQLSRAEEALRTALRAVGVEEEDLARSTSLYYELCTKHRQLEKADAQLAVTDAKLERFTTVETAARNGEIGMNSTEAGLQRIFRRAGIDETDTEQALRVFETKCEQAETALRTREEVTNQSRELRALLSDQSIDQLNRRREELSARVDALLAAHPEWLDMIEGDSLDVLEHHLDKSRDQLASTQSELAAIEERLANGLRGLRALVDVEEEIEATEQTIAELALHGEALQLAEKHLSAAADEHHRNFLPRLNQLVGQSFSQVTGGRYGSIQIDHSDLQVRLQVPNLLHPVTPEVLSRGAQEQIYLMLRLGLTELMSNGRERLPLILDDPLVNYDRDRLLRGLDFLAEIAGRGQVLLFTKDDETVRWFQSRHEHSDTHKLHTL